MRLTVGDKIIYPFQGPCLIARVVERTVNKQAEMFYQLTRLSSGGGDIFVPVDRADTIGIRQLLKRSDIPGLLGHLGAPVQEAEDWKCRRTRTKRLFSSGRALDLAEIIQSLSAVRGEKALSFEEQKMLDRAMMLLVCEVAEVTGLSRAKAQTEVEDALITRHSLPLSLTRKRGGR